MKSPKTYIAALTMLLSVSFASAQEAEMFPFQPTHSAPSNLTNVSTWSSVPALPAGSEGFIAASGDHFVDGRGQERRFLGTNICFTGCFPEKADADRVAEELARYGINLVRLHYVHHVTPKGGYPQEDSFLEPVQLDRFDYLLAALKKKGIYTYFQLNIARKFGSQNGFVNADRLPVQNNGIDSANSRMIYLHKKYVGEILRHVNPYTGLAYRDEPAIGMLEITNENSIVYSWFASKYNFPYLTEPYASEVKEIWNEWLQNKYESTKALKAAWLEGVSGDGTQYLPEGRMGEEAEALWAFQLDDLAQASWSRVPATGKDKLKGKYYARLKVDKIGASKNMPQFYRTGLKVTDGAPFCLKMKMRTDTPGNVSVRLSQAHSPWGVAGLNSTVKIDTKWKEYTFNFRSNMNDDDVRLVLSTFTPGNIDLADVSLVAGMDYKWPDDQFLEDGTIDWPYRSDWSMMEQRALDFTEFLGYIENLYLTGMYSHIKGSVKPRQCVTGTQLTYGFTLPEAMMDYCDMHSYWCHPYFPGKSWSRTNWNLQNKALVNGDDFPATNLAEMARTRILGKPVTISEYDHPNLNFYSAEGNLMAAAFGAFQNWSGILQFAWTHDTDFFRDVQGAQFDLCSATQKLVHFPACWAMFVRGDVSTGDNSMIYAPLASSESERKAVAKGQNSFALAKEGNKLLAALPMAMPAGKTLAEKTTYKGNGKLIRTEEEVPQTIKDAFASKEIVSNGGQLTWNWQEKGAGYFKVDTRNTKVFTGFVKGRSFEYEGLTITPGKTILDWMTLSLTNTNPSSAAQKGRVQKGTYLLAATGRVHNTDAVIVDLGNNSRISCAAENGGNVGHAPILCEGVPATLCFRGLAGKVQCWALDPEGNRMAQLPVEADAEGNAVLNIGAQYRTVWYELNID